MAVSTVLLAFLPTRDYRYAINAIGDCNRGLQSQTAFSVQLKNGKVRDSVEAIDQANKSLAGSDVRGGARDLRRYRSVLNNILSEHQISGYRGTRSVRGKEKWAR